jgi:hypothetical protein
MPLHSSYDIYLEADGVRLQEYDVVFDGSKSPPTVSCWIPSESGKVRPWWSHAEAQVYLLSPMYRAL